jgi:hypothetical protein
MIMNLPWNPLMANLFTTLKGCNYPVRDPQHRHHTPKGVGHNLPSAEQGEQVSGSAVWHRSKRMEDCLPCCCLLL